jgi:hypothetical protein
LSSFLQEDTVPEMAIAITAIENILMSFFIINSLKIK